MKAFALFLIVVAVAAMAFLCSTLFDPFRILLVSADQTQDVLLLIKLYEVVPFFLAFSAYVISCWELAKWAWREFRQ